MKRFFVVALYAALAGVSLAGLAGCGGSSSSTPVVPVASITSFTAASATITDGTSTTLTGVFTGGTGKITPGNLPATSGTPVAVSPAATTTYTLTVTPTGGTAVTQTVTVTVNAVVPPAISSFTASPATIAAGGSSMLTGVFSGGTGVITPGDVPATSGTAVTVAPTATTIYTLTVTPATGTAVTQTVTVTVNPVTPTISSFVASPSTINAGQSSNLTATFSGGTGMITPGNLPATSGAAVSVSPTATTIYTLTVTPATGAAINQTVTVTVNPLVKPSISSFTAVPSAIAPNGSSMLTGTFTGGTGVITPGNLPATSGTAVTVSPTATTMYTLTVTPVSGTAVTATVTVTVATASTVTVDLSSSGPKVTDQLLGMNLASWWDDASSTNAPMIQSAFDAAGIKAIRWPGGSWSDVYHWQTNSNCQSGPHGGGTPDSNDVFGNFVSNFALPAGVDLALTANYGSNAACNGGGEPSEAAAWAAQAITDGITVSHMTVGNEEYGNWEEDLHSIPNDPATYAAAVTGASGYYALIKAASPSTLVGVDVEADNTVGGWDNTVLANAKGSYDFVEFHYYPETPGEENDTFLVQQAAQELTTDINTLRTELTAAGEPDTPIYVGEIGGPYSNPGKQSWSITQGLYAGQVLGEMMNDGVSRLTWWIGFGNCNGTGTPSDPANFSASLYGWQDFGAYNVFSDGAQDADCPGAGAFGTMSPTARAFQLFSQVALTGETVLTATVGGDTTDVRAYAATNNGGTALVLFNDNETTSQQVVVTLTGKSSSSAVIVTTYDKALYDQSASDVWAGPTTTSIGSQTLPLTLILTPWSMNVVIIK